MRREHRVLMVMDDGDALDVQLSAGSIRCPSCSGSLKPWGWARARRVRTLAGERWLRPRRGRCQSCEVSAVLLPAWCLPRRRDAAEVVLSAMRAKAGGDGHRRIAERLGRPPGTVRNWLRRAAQLTEELRTSAIRWAYALDAELPPIAPSGSALAGALDALGTAVSAGVRRLGPREPAELAVRYGLGVVFCGSSPGP
jgi:hypothetical protein